MPARSSKHTHATHTHLRHVISHAVAHLWGDRTGGGAGKEAKDQSVCVCVCTMGQASEGARAGNREGTRGAGTSIDSADQMLLWSTPHDGTRQTTSCTTTKQTHVRNSHTPPRHVASPFSSPHLSPPAAFSPPPRRAATPRHAPAARWLTGRPSSPCLPEIAEKSILGAGDEDEDDEPPALFLACSCCCWICVLTLLVVFSSPEGACAAAAAAACAYVEGGGTKGS